MKSLHIFIAITLAALLVTAGLTSCGDNLKVPDAKVHDARPDAACSNCPAAPSLGTQIDRLGRPAINTVLNHGFDGTVAAGPAKDAYNIDGSKGGWLMYTAQFAANLAIVDVLDTGLTCTDGTCTAEAVPTLSDGCGNQVEYNGMLNGNGSANAAMGSYNTLAGILTDDELFVDTTIGAADIASSHANYLAVEFNALSGIPNTTCGGRAPTNDVIDTSYTALAIGITGFKVSDGSFKAAFGDGVGPHADVSNDTFPFLGTPH
jgi:hypothetical protein